MKKSNTNNLLFLKVITISFMICISGFSLAKSQVPENIHYQFTVKDENGKALPNTTVGVRIKVINQDSEIFYQERQVLETNYRGLISFIIGEGTEKAGDLSKVNWVDEDKKLYIKIEVDPTGGKIYTLVAYNRINRFPSAIQAKYVESIEEKDFHFRNSIASTLDTKTINQYNNATRDRHYNGDKVGGGVVFYVDATGENGMVASLQNLNPNAAWEPSPHSNNETSSFDGEINTRKLIDSKGPGDYAAYITDTFTVDGKDDWYLPSSEELSMLFDAGYEVNKSLAEDGDLATEGLKAETYWSSTEESIDNAILFEMGNPVAASKDTPAAVRAVRKFRGLYDVKNFLWAYLGGPEDENGDDVQILENTEGDLLEDVDGSRGTVFRPLPVTNLPVKLTFNMQTIYDPGTSEPPTLLFGTGDFRLFVGGPNKMDAPFPMAEDNLGEFEGVQFRIHPHLDESPIRRYTYNDGERESHTCTSFWIRNVNPDKRLDDDGNPHTGLVSDICQGRGNHCGWQRVDLFENSLGLENGEVTEVTIIISHTRISFEANGRIFSTEISDIENDEDIEGDVLRFEQVTHFAIGHTNISRGYDTIRITDLRIIPLEEPQK